LMQIPELYFFISNYNQVVPWSKGYARYTNDMRQMFAASLPTELIIPKVMMRAIYRNDRNVYWVSLGSNRSVKGNLENFVDEILPEIKRPFILISTDGDRDVPDGIEDESLQKLLGNPFLRRWYSQNTLSCDSDKLAFVPIGLDLHTNRGMGIGDRKLKIYLEVGKQSFQVNGRIVADCLARPTSPQRSRIASVLGKLWIDNDLCIPENKTERELWMIYRSSDIVLSVTGNGWDCHRTWEAGFLGVEVICDENPISLELKTAGATIIDFDEASSGREVDLRKLAKGKNRFQCYWIEKMQMINNDIENLGGEKYGN